MAEEFRVLRPYEFHCQLISKGRRADGRTLEETRDVKLEIDAIKTADSSSLVKLGNTSLVCGCQARLLDIKSQRDDGNEFKIKLEMPPICSSPTGYKTQQTAQILNNMLKNILDDTNCIDKRCLYLAETDQYWSIDVEIICLNYDGCLLDAALIAILIALKSLRLTTGSKEILDRSFELNSFPICSSFAIVGDHFICDPNLEEETVAQSTYSITIDPTSKRNCHINKTGGKSISANQLMRCIDLAKKRAIDLQERITVKLSSSQDEENMNCSQ